MARGRATRGTWETRETLKDVKAFHHYCAAHKLNAFFPKSHPLWEASMPKAQKRTAAQLKVPEPPQYVAEKVTGPGAEEKKRKEGDRSPSQRQAWTAWRSVGSNRPQGGADYPGKYTQGHRNRA